MTTTQSTQAPGRADPTTKPASEHAGDRQTFELYGRRIANTNHSDVQQLLAAAHTDQVRPGDGPASWPRWPVRIGPPFTGTHHRTG